MRTLRLVERVVEGCVGLDEERQREGGGQAGEKDHESDDRCLELVAADIGERLAQYRSHRTCTIASGEWTRSLAIDPSMSWMTRDALALARRSSWVTRTTV